MFGHPKLMGIACRADIVFAAYLGHAANLLIWPCFNLVMGLHAQSLRFVLAGIFVLIVDWFIERLLSYRHGYYVNDGILHLYTISTRMFRLLQIPIIVYLILSILLFVPNISPSNKSVLGASQLAGLFSALLAGTIIPLWSLILLVKHFHLILKENEESFGLNPLDVKEIEVFKNILFLNFHNPSLYEPMLIWSNNPKYLLNSITANGGNPKIININGFNSDESERAWWEMREKYCWPRSRQVLQGYAG